MTKASVRAPKQLDVPEDEDPAAAVLVRAYGHMQEAMADMLILEAHLDPSGTALSEVRNRWGQPQPRVDGPSMRQDAPPEPRSDSLICCDLAPGAWHDEMLRLLRDGPAVAKCLELVRSALEAEPGELIPMAFRHYGDFEDTDDVYHLLCYFEEVLGNEAAAVAARRAADQTLPC